MGVSAALGDQGSCLPRIAALTAGPGWPEVTGLALQRFCGSGLEAVNLAGEKIRSGWYGLVAAGGFESLSRMGLGSAGGAMVNDPATSTRIGYVSQGVSADLLASMAGYSREELDRFAVSSQQKAAKARREGRFAKSLVPVQDQNGLSILAHDEYIRENTTLEGLTALQPAFADVGAAGYDVVALQKYPQVERINHLHTSGNSSGIVDGAALVLVGSERIGRELGLTPRGRIAGVGSAAVDPTIMLTGPVPATRRALEKAGLGVDDIDLFEVNEAFAVVPLYFAKSLNIPLEKVNVNGGAIALGHPIGATGAMLLGTLLDELERRSLRYGAVTLCIAGGMGIATVIERL
jgi:acetyl-CoA C-acetyltransferase